MSIENGDSRKRPLDIDPDGGITKRSNQGATDNPGGDVLHLKILVPSIAAGAIIGKGGETITQIQKDTGGNIKMSKANDFYPGTTERVCLITGSFESVKKAHEFIMERIREKPDPNPKPVDGDLKVNFERHKQVKLLIPNSTAGMIIGKGGNFIRQIKDESGSYVQISQKSKEMNLPERCVTIAENSEVIAVGSCENVFDVDQSRSDMSSVSSDSEQNKRAVEMILEKIMDDPQSGSCPNISYADYKGPVASSNPTGSPYASQQGGPGAAAAPPVGATGPNRPHPAGVMGPSGVYSMNNSMNNLHINTTPQTGPPAPIPPPPGPGGPHPAGPPPGPHMGSVGPPPGGSTGGGGGNHTLENLKCTLRANNYTELAVEDISSAMFTLASYGFLGLGLGLSFNPMNNVPPAGPPGPGGFHPHGNPVGPPPHLNLAIMAGLLGGSATGLPPNGPPQGPLPQGATATGPDGSTNVFGPAGSVTTTMAGGDTGEGSPYYYSTPNLNNENYSGNGDSVFKNYKGNNPNGNNGNLNGGYTGTNQNSFGLGTGMGSMNNSSGAMQGNNGSFNNAGCDGPATSKDLEVGEHIVGAVLGPGGRGIVEIQNVTGVNIQISKKGVYVPGTRNRIVTITGGRSNIDAAQFLVQQCISQEEAKRARQGSSGGR